MQVTYTQANVINRYTGTLLSEWKPEDTSEKLTAATTVSGYLCIIQNNIIHLLSCETPSTSNTNNRIRKISLQQENIRKFNEEILCLDTISLPKNCNLSSSVLDPSHTQKEQPPSSPSPSSLISTDSVLEKTLNNLPNIDSMESVSSLDDSMKDESMVDIWKDICMDESLDGSSMGNSKHSNVSNAPPPVPVLDTKEIQSSKIIEQSEGFIVCCLKESRSVILLSVPSLQSIAIHSFGITPLLLFFLSAFISLPLSKSFISFSRMHLLIHFFLAPLLPPFLYSSSVSPTTFLSHSSSSPLVSLFLLSFLSLIHVVLFHPSFLFPEYNRSSRKWFSIRLTFPYPFPSSSLAPFSSSLGFFAPLPFFPLLFQFLHYFSSNMNSITEMLFFFIQLKRKTNQGRGNGSSCIPKCSE